MDCPRLMLSLAMLALILNQTGSTAEAAINIGVNYGLLGDNLPSPHDVISLYKIYNIRKLRIFDPNPDVLNALRGSGLEVSLGMKNQDLPNLAASQEAVNAWFATNVQPYLNDVNIKYITVGNEVIPGQFGPPVLPVMRFLHNLITSNNLNISVSTTVAGSNLATSYPPSNSSFTAQAREQLVPVLKFLSETGSPLLVNVYPYFAYASDPVHIRLDYAVFNATETVVKDRELAYSNMFDAMFDAFVWAMEKEGVSNVAMAVSESGWPSAGNGNLTTPEIAETYNRNFVKHILSGAGTPKRPNTHIDGFIFAMFNENKKEQGVEQNFGLFYPDMKPVYKLF